MKNLHQQFSHNQTITSLLIKLKNSKFILAT